MEKLINTLLNFGETGEHSKNVFKIARILFAKTGRYSNKEIDMLSIAALLHDVGKLKTPLEILENPLPLSEGEWVVMRQHTLIGEEMIKELSIKNEKLNIYILNTIKHHHERIDGNGYPSHLKSNEYQLKLKLFH